MSWNLDSDRPIFAQIVEHLQYDIISGVYQPGQKLPSVRDLAAMASVNPNTMQRAFSELEREGLVSTNRTTGRTVTEDPALISDVRKELASNHVTCFFRKMKELGYTNEEITALTSEAATREENE